ncbi:hypothetical protein Gotri_027014, partial [Gossypium trilobum]|nr:hypothetical protein [Gossypium trilobum]
MKGIRSILIAFGLFAFACSSASAYDPSPLQDFCVAIKDIKNGGTHSRLCVNVHPHDVNKAGAEQHYVS